MRPAKPEAGWPIAEVFQTLGLVVPPTQALELWLDRLAEWNAKIDLTAAKSAIDLAWLMIADAAMLVGAIAKDAVIVDVGTGAGAPGLALAILRPDLRWTIAEPLAKRAAFLRTVLGELRRTDVTLLAKRGEELPTGTFDEAISRATLPPQEWLALGARLVRPGGAVRILVAREPEPTEATCALDVASTISYDTPTGARRILKYVRSDAA